MRAKTTRFGRIFLLGVAVALAVILVTAPGGAVAGGARSGSTDTGAHGAPVNYHQWDTPSQFASGTGAGTESKTGGLTVGSPVGTERHARPDGNPATYDYARWTSPTYRQGFGATELVASWNADTPTGTWLKIEMRGRTSAGVRTDWYVLGEWASGDTDIKRTSVNGQSDAAGAVYTDTFATKDGVTLESYQLRATLYRASGTTATPMLRTIGAMTSAIPDRYQVPTSPENGAWGRELPVPAFSQNIHKGQYPEYGGGGENWCSPASTSMVVDYWGAGPTAREMSWIDPSTVDPSVVYAARNTFDYAYGGTGNWPFNTAYAASRGLDGHITRLGSLADVERYISSGIPVITSLSFNKGEIDGTGYGTSGHIMVIVGFTPTGDVIANDPASSSDDAVRNIYPRGQFETAWERTKRYDENGKPTSGTGGVAYIITPHAMTLPN